MTYLDPQEAFEHFRDRVVSGISSQFPMKGKTQTLELVGALHVEDNLHADDIRDQHKARLEGTSWHVPVFGHLVLRDNATGKEVDSKQVRLATIPKMTRRYSYIVDGQEYQVDGQWQLKPGVYTRRRSNGELESRFNTPGRGGFDMTFDPSSKRFLAEYKSSKIPLYPILKTMGVDDNTLEAAWGKEIFQLNKHGREVKGAVEKFYKADTGSQAPSAEAAERHVRELLEGSALRPESTSRTLGQPFTHISGEAMHLASKRLLAVQGGAPEDDRDALVFKDLRSIGDFAYDKIRQATKDIRKKIDRKVNTSTSIGDIVTARLFSDPIRSVFRTSVARAASQVNPVEMLSGASQTTVMGPGGIQSDRSVSEDTKMINATHFGFLDPLNTPEGDKAGVTLRLPLGIRKDGTVPKMRVYDIAAKKIVAIPPEEFLEKHVVLPDQVRWKNGEPVPVGPRVQMLGKENAVEHLEFARAHYVLPHASQLFSPTTNLVPFLGNNSGGRAGMAARHIEQAIPLVAREAPLVQVATGSDRPGAETFEKVLGRQAAHFSPVSGEVTRVTKDAIHVKAADGTSREVQTYNHYPLNDAKAMYHSTARVKVGDRVAAGGLLADTNYSKDGTLALGTNLRVAYIPFKGYNFEDGIVLSQSAANKLASEHLHKPTLQVAEGTRLVDPHAFNAMHTGVYSKEALKNIDSDGVVRVGTKVRPGDPLVLAVQPATSRDSMGAGAIRRWATGTLANRALQWDSEFPGEVVGVHRVGKFLKVHVRSVEPMQVGDKLAFRFGDKGIATKIVPDHEMPKTRDGKPVEVALNPSGIPGRMNVGQVLETAASKIAEKTGKPYHVENFDPSRKDAVAQMRAELAKHGLHDTEELIDPTTGLSLGHALVGKKYALKLNHQVEKKVSARGGMGLPGIPSTEGYDINMQPTGGGHEGGQATGALGLYALLGHGAKATVREMHTWKSEGTDPTDRWPSQHAEVWRAIRTGDPLPTPKPTFAWQKFVEMLRGAGINTEKQGHELVLTPLTDKHVLGMSGGAIKSAGRVVREKLGPNGYPKPLPGGLFDERVTGGHGGTKWSHIDLAEPLPNPVFRDAICSVAGLTRNEYEDIVFGAKGVDTRGKLVEAKAGVTGGAGIKHLLAKIDTTKALAEARANLENAPAAKVDAALKRTRYLRALDQLGMRADEAYVLHHLPVLPPAMRPIMVLGDGNLKYEDVNGLYQKFGQINDKLKDPVLAANLTDAKKAGLRRAFYDGVRAIMGVGIPYDDQKEKGLLHQVKGATPKEGYFQSVLTSRRQDLSMRSTIIPEPALGLDEVGLPRDAALTIYRPFLVRKLIEMGAAPTDLRARELLSQAHKDAKPPREVMTALDRVIDERPVLLKRDPMLHKYSIQGFKPRIVDGNAIRIHPLVTAGFNADFDGDSIDLDTPMPLRVEGRVQHLTGRQLIDLLDAGGGNYVVQTRAVEAWTYRGWKPVKTVSFHTVETKKKFRVTLRNGRTVIVSEDHSLMVGGQQARPAELTEGTQLDFRPVALTASGDSYERGVLYGHFLGDGCAALRPHGGGRVSLACKPHAEREYLMRLWREEFGVHVTRERHGFSVSNVSLAAQFLEECGQYCHGKHIGADLLDRGTEFLRGLLAGHILSDGSVEATRSGSFLIRTWSRSQALQETMSLIASALGLPHSTRVHVSKGQRNYLLSFGKEAIKALDYRCVGKKNLLIQQARYAYQTQRKDARKSQSERGFEVLRVEEVEYTERMVDLEVDDVSHVFAILDGVIVHNTMAAYVPISAEAVAEARKMMPSSNLLNDANGKAMYQPTLESALGLFKLSRVGKDTDHKFKSPHEAVAAVAEGRVHYTDVVHVNGVKTTVGRAMLAETVPDAWKPRILTDFSLRIDKKGLDELLGDLAKNHKGSYGQHVNAIKDLGNAASYGIISTPLHPKPIAVGTHTLSLADFETDRGTRDRIVEEFQKRVDTVRGNTALTPADRDRRSVDLWTEAEKRIKAEHLAKGGAPSNLELMRDAGVKPGWDQYKQLTLAPMLLKDSRNRTIPTPVTRSYGEGLDVGGYWLGTYGARRGAVMKTQEVREPGYMSKLLQATAMNQMVDAHDCGTSKGIVLPATGIDAHGRYLARSFKDGGLDIPAGTALTTDLLGKIRATGPAAKVIVRSPLKCEHDKGLCQKCLGHTVDGHDFALGTNAGVLSASAVGERAVQLPMKAFHCMHEHSVVAVRVAGRAYHTTLGRVFAALAKGKIVGGEETRATPGLEVWDRGGWVRVLSAQRHVQQPGTAMVFTRVRAGCGIISQDNHPHMLAENAAVCPTCRTYPKCDNAGRQYRCRKCRRRFAPADLLPSTDFAMVEPQELTAKSHAALRLSDPVVITMRPALRDGWLAGVYCAEGSLHVRQEAGEDYLVGFHIAQNAGTPVRRKIGKALRAEFPEARIGASLRYYRVYGRERAAKIGKAFGRYSRDKGLPDGWGGLPRKWLRDFVAGVFDGDGTFTTTKDSRWAVAAIDTTSFLLAQQLQWILRQEGVQARVVLTPWRKLSRHQGFRVVFVATRRARRLLSASVRFAAVAGKPQAHAERFPDVVDYVRPVRFASPPYVYDLETETGTLGVGGLWTHNSGGVASGDGKAVSAFVRFHQLITLPEKFPNAASLAMHSGTVTKIEPDATGVKIHIGSHVHHVAKDEAGQHLHEPLPGAQVHPAWTPPKVGHHVEAGQLLSDPSRTYVNPHTLYAATGSIERVQNHITNELHEIYKDEGVLRRNFEVLVKAMSNLTEVRDPGDHHEMLRGEYHPTSVVKRINETELAGKRPITHTPVLKGVDILPLEMTEDWLAKLQHQRLTGTLLEGVSTRARASLHGVHPIPGAAYGAEFGLTRANTKQPGLGHLVNVPLHHY